VKCFKHGYVIAKLCEIARAGKSRGTRADDGYPMSVLRSGCGRCVTMRIVPIGNKALESADTDRLSLYSSNTL
jgi:hypothetical protein